MNLLRPWTVVVLLVATACSGGQSAPAPAPAPAPGAAPAAAAQENPATPEVTKKQLSDDSENNTLVPSPIETQKALEKAGIETQLSALISKRKMDVTNKNPDDAAVRTGVVIADMLLTVKTSSKEDLLTQLDEVETGMQQLQGGHDIKATIDDIKDRVKGDAVTRDELLKELDEISQAVIPELRFNGKERVVPLIQAGSWLEGANLLAKAVKAANKPSAADALLKQPAVVDYFLHYVQTQGQNEAPEAVTAKLETSLKTLKGIASKPGSLTAEDIDTVAKTTDDVLALL